MAYVQTSRHTAEMTCSQLEEEGRHFWDLQKKPSAHQNGISDPHLGFINSKKG